MKNKPAILFLLPVLLLLTGSSLKASSTDRATSTLATYTWLADGTKYSSERPDGSGYVYKGELIFRTDPDGGLSLDCVLTTGGRIVAERDAAGALTGYAVRHHIRDHLGSVRAVTDATTGEVLETSDYLPFGTRWAMTGGSQDAASTLTDPSNRWRYSGKEEQQALSPDLSLLDYGARMYDPLLARWLTPDPFAEKYLQWSPYGYCVGNPIRMTDDGGLDIVLTGRESSSVTIKTDLLDMSFNVSGLGINWGGNYTFEGDNVLSAALDIAGYFDPTGIADGANATLLASQGHYLGALQSAAGALVPYIGDLAKAPRLGRSIETLSAAVNLGKAETRVVENVVTFRKFTQGNFRENLSRMTGVNPSGMEAHHTIPVKFEKEMTDLGVNVHDPKYGAWLPKDKHRKTAHEYNKRWESLFDKKNLSIKDVEQFAKDLMKELYGKE
ncbi:MAG: RHS repeat domain-containing protein [Candidatus Cryptobacteroides sp.]